MMTQPGLPHGGNAYGHFGQAPASFVIDSPDLPTGWDYVYQNRAMLLRVDQHGPIYAQAHPPSDIMLFRREAFQRDSSWLVWLQSADLRCGAFTNFFRPLLAGTDAVAQPETFRVTYAPSHAVYDVAHEGVGMSTRFFLPPHETTVCMEVRITNHRKTPLSLSVIPALRPYVNPAQLAPWDKPEWYLKTALINEPFTGFRTQLLNMNGEPAKRRTVALLSSADRCTGAEISYEQFVGQGSWCGPQAVADGKLRLPLSEAHGWTDTDDTQALYGYPPAHALSYEITLQAGEQWTLRQALTLIPQAANGAPPDAAAVKPCRVYLSAKACEAAIQANETKYASLMKLRTIATPDEALNRYVNEWLPVQMDWVAALDRGWPSGMRGARDSANDFTAMVPLEPAWSRAILCTLMECQRRDGWFPRQYSADGRLGKHDLRGHVDAGVWVIELLHEYLSFTRDYELLKEELPWLDSDTKSSVWEHALAAAEYFIRDENIGEHGLCKVREGEWLDSVNRAGIKGRGEGVMISGQLIIALTQMAEIITALETANRIGQTEAATRRDRFMGKVATLRTALRTHAYNPQGYFNGFFNDDGKWLFSDRDPDGERRVYGPANWFALASGAALPDLADSVLKELAFLRSPGGGFRLLYPPMGKIPLEAVGRGGTGDQPGGLWENGTVYNQGSHGFLIRGLAAAGKGDLLYEVLRCLLPYDQEIHPVSASLTPPYAVVNCYLEVPGFMHRGGLMFLTGSIAYALRAAYQWMFGIKPQLDGLVVDPCIPKAFGTLSARFSHRGHGVRLSIENPHARECGVRSLTVNRRPVTTHRTDPFSGRTVFVAADELFDRDDNIIEVTLG